MPTPALIQPRTHHLSSSLVALLIARAPRETKEEAIVAEIQRGACSPLGRRPGQRSMKSTPTGCGIKMDRTSYLLCQNFANFRLPEHQKESCLEMLMNSEIFVNFRENYIRIGEKDDESDL